MKDATPAFGTVTIENDITPAFIGLVIGKNVFYNVVEEHGEFSNTGLFITQYLRKNKHEFMAKILESQNYETIKAVFDDKFIFGNHLAPADMNKSNTLSLDATMELMRSRREFFYLFNFKDDVLIIKTPSLPEPLALDYNSNEDIRAVINKLIPT